MYLKKISWAGTYHILFGFMSIIGFAFGLLCNMGLTHQSSCPELYCANEVRFCVGNLRLINSHAVDPVIMVFMFKK